MPSKTILLSCGSITALGLTIDSAKNSGRMHICHLRKLWAYTFVALADNGERLSLNFVAFITF